MRPEFQKILNNTKHPIARDILRQIMEQHDVVMERFRRAAENKICWEREKLEQRELDFGEVVELDEIFENDDDDPLDDPLEGLSAEELSALLEVIKEDRKELTELDYATLHRYVSKAQHRLLKQKFGSHKPRDQVRRRTNKVVGIKRAQDRLDKEGQSKEPYDEGLGTAIGNFVTKTAADVVGHGLGVSGATVHKFAPDLTSRKSAKPASITKPKQLIKPKHSEPIGSTHSTQQHEPSDHVMPSDVHSNIAGVPGEHENHLNDFINHHNAAVEAKAKGDHRLAAIKFRARNAALVRYTNSAPKAHLKHLNTNKVHQMMQIKEEAEE